MGQNKVMIRICGTGYAPEDTQRREGVRTETTVQGEYYEKNGALYLFWEEHMEGVDEPVQSRMKYRDGCIEVTRRGGMNSLLVFETGKTYCTDYATPLGAMRMEIAADAVTMEETADGTRRVTAGYRLCQEGETVSCCLLELEIYFTGFAPPFS